jgi:hypothetical protein
MNCGVQPPLFLKDHHTAWPLQARRHDFMTCSDQRAAPTGGHSLDLSVFGEQNTGGDLSRDPSDAEPEIRWP